MLFHFLNVSQCGSGCGHKTLYNVTNLNVQSKRRYLIFKQFLFKNYNEQLIWTTKLFSFICDITNCKSRLLKFELLVGGENAWLSSGRFKIETQCRCFYITVFLMETQLFSENVVCHFHFILYIISDKAAFVTGALFCVQRYRGNLKLSRYNSASRWQIINLHIYAATKSEVCRTMNKCNCLTVSLQFML